MVALRLDLFWALERVVVDGVYCADAVVSLAVGRSTISTSSPTIKDDDDDHIAWTHYQSGPIDRDNPRVEIRIEVIEDQAQ